MSVAFGVAALTVAAPSLGDVLLAEATGRAVAQELSPAQLAQLQAMELPTEPSTLLAIVGDNPILLGDLMPKIESRIMQLAKGDISQIPPEQLKILRLRLLRALLAQTIQTKMLGHAFMMSQVGASSAEQRREAQTKIAAQARRAFYESEIPRMLEESKLNSIQELDAKLRESGSSLKTLEHEYQDKMLGAVYIQKLVPRDPAVTLNELRAYYEKHREEFSHPARARWEQLTVLFSRFPNKQEADRAISDMGREAYFGGNMQKVAKERSQEPLAASGGLHDWTRQGSLASKVLDEQIFSLPLNRMSPRIEDADGYHIIRVLDREEAGVTPLGELQDELRKKIQAQKVAEAEAKLMQEIRRDVPVWSLYPDDVDGAMPLGSVERSRTAAAVDASPAR
ncbi:peptidylprolyl isomerase [Candidatus Laterigemmans baculatus]|uniref:peptidylprolyl isomerase n=1 Tax=Candidatus Laterigemmans baculatus TaxID=2770505 RepID=UPI001F30B961|nr:peptidylprolyl isomerase [Candidatus Laterigemmans baculatus]